MNPPPNLEEDAIARLIRLAGEPPAADAARVERTRRSVHQTWRRAVAQRRRQRVVVWSTGLAAALLLVVGPLSRQGPAAPPRQLAATPIATVARLSGTGAHADGVALADGAVLRPGAVLETAAAGRIALALGPLRSLRLDHTSRLRLVGEGRVELLAGAVFLDALPGAPEGFVVSTPWGDVLERGTQFEARLGTGDLVLRVREGAVELVAGKERQVVEAGYELAWTGRGQHHTAPLSVRDPAWAWAWEAAPRFELEGATLAEFLAWFERETRERVRLTAALEARSGAIRLHGATPDASAAELLAAVLSTCGIEAVPEEGGWFASPAAP